MARSGAAAVLIGNRALSKPMGQAARLGRILPRRTYGSKPKDKIVLEKPLKFNPPSHGRKLPTGKGPRHYGGALSDSEIQAQARRDYPGMPPPKGSFGHDYFLNPRAHLLLTMAVLGSLAFYTLLERFKENSPYSFMLPSLYDWLRHPIDSIGQFWNMVQLNTEHNTRMAMEGRRKAIEDITKRKKYRRAHDIEDVTFLHKVIPEKYIKSMENSFDEAHGEEAQRREREEREEAARTKEVTSTS